MDDQNRSLADTHYDFGTSGRDLGPILLVLLVFALSAAAILAMASTGSARSEPRPTPPCGGLYAQCCDDWQDWQHPDEDQRIGLFDAEERFTGSEPPAGC